jgi:hypothetical protein
LSQRLRSPQDVDIAKIDGRSASGPKSRSRRNRPPRRRQCAGRPSGTYAARSPTRRSAPPILAESTSRSRSMR